MLSRLKSFFTQEKGASPWIAVFAMTVLLAFTAMAVDLGTAYLQTSKLQAALDAGALAGASGLPNTANASSAAIDCVQRNGFTSSDVVISFSDSNSKITVSSSKKVKTLFLGALGINEWTINRKAVAAKTASAGGGVFNYRIFYGDPNSTLEMGGTFDINGDVHSNGSYKGWPNTGKITGALEIHQPYNPSQVGNTTIGKIVNPAQYIEMPDFTPVVENIMPTRYDEYANASVYNSSKDLWWRQTWTGSKYITGNVTVTNGLDIYGDVYIKGNLTIYGGGPFIIDGNLYVDGTIEFGNNVNITGSVMSTNTITFTGGSNFVNTSKPICIYSKNGDINITMQTMTTTGIVYAPNGTVNIAGSNLTFNGSIVAKYIKGMITGLKVGEPTVPIDFLPQGEDSVKLVG